MRSFMVMVLMMVLAGCKGNGAPPAQAEEGVSKLLSRPGQVSFDPTGTMFVATEGMNLAIRKPGDGRVFWLTLAPPVKAGRNELPDGDDPEPGVERCIPAAPGATLPGPQGGWHGHPAWSPDGRFIAFMAPWQDGNCVDGDDGDWDIWMVNVDGLDLTSWVEDVDSGKKDEQGAPIMDHFIVGPDGAGLSFFLVASGPGTDQRPVWITCHDIAWTGASGVFTRSLSHIPGICDKTSAQVIEEQKREISELRRNTEKVEKECKALDAQIAPQPGPTGEPAPAPTSGP